MKLTIVIEPKSETECGDCHMLDKAGPLALRQIGTCAMFDHIVLGFGRDSQTAIRPQRCRVVFGASLPALTSAETNPDATEASQASASPTTRI